MRVVYDIETYPNVFTLAAEHVDYPITWAFEISDHRNDSKEIVRWLLWLKREGGSMVGFNNIGFDYPVLHMLIRSGVSDAATLYEKAKSIIECMEFDRFKHAVFPSDRFVTQIDLFKIYHFDNKAKSTSLKNIQFNMRMKNIRNLPFPVGKVLSLNEIEILKKYNVHDVKSTKDFYLQSLKAVSFREELSRTYQTDFVDFSDVKIGKTIFQKKLESFGVQCYEYTSAGRKPKQSLRLNIKLNECIPDWVKFDNPEFQKIKDYLTSQTIVNTKGAFTDLSVTINGIDFVFGTGGIHASVNDRSYRSTDEHMILDIDVQSLYPSIAIEHGYYPEHLGSRFVDVYRELKKQRVSYPKGSTENDVLKLALNGVYGASGDAYSVFYDPLFTMKITLTGQMMIAMLAEKLMTVQGLRIIQCNTDGVTMWILRRQYDEVKKVTHEWEQLTKMHLEYVEYSKMFIRDVNNYLAVDTKGKIKRKGAYGYELDWHQNHSSLVVQKVAEKVLIEGIPIRQAIEGWSDMYDFMCRVKVNKGTTLIGESDDLSYVELEPLQRYYVAKGGVRLFKLMPPLPKNPDKVRKIGVESGWTVCPCNDIDDAVLPVDYDYYVEEIEKLCMNVI